MTRTSPTHQFLQKDGKYYFNDGDCVLQVDGHLFRVHKFLLKRNSDVFRDMFNTEAGPGLGMAADGIIEGSSDDHPIIFPETLEAFRALCWLIYASPGEIRSAQNTKSFGNINELVLIAFLAHKYRFEGFEEWAFDVLEDLSRDPSALSVVSDMRRIEDLLFITIECERHVLAGRLQSLLVAQVSGDDPITQLQGVLAVAERAEDEDFQARAYYAYIKATCFTNDDEPEPVQSNKLQDFGCPFPLLKSSQLTEIQSLRLRYGYQSLRNIRSQMNGYPDLLSGGCDHNCDVRWRQWWQKTWRCFAGLAERRYGDPGEVMTWMLEEVESGSGHPACSKSLGGVTCKEQRQTYVREMKSEFERGIRRQFGFLWEDMAQ